MGTRSAPSIRWASVLVTVLLSVSCSANPSQEAAPATPPPLPRGAVSIETASGEIGFAVEIAETDAARQAGLMDRESLPEGTGMVFLFDTPSDGAFWMKDTLIPLSIAFWDEGGRVVDVLDMQPCEADPCPLYQPGGDYVGALEVEAGELTGVRPGDTVGLQR